MRLRNGLLVILAVAAFPASASAEPAFTATMSGASPVFNWEGTGSGVTDPFGDYVTCANADVHTCQDVLFHVEEAGDLTFAIDSHDEHTVSEPTGEVGDIVTFQDIDTYLYPSDATGAINGESMSEESASTKGDETFTMKSLQPGYYLLQIEVFLGAEASWTGKAELTNVAPKAPVVAVEAPAPPQPAAEQPAPAAQQQPAAQEPAPAAKPAPAKKKAVSKKAACKKKAKKIKNKGKRKKALKKCAKIRK